MPDDPRLETFPPLTTALDPDGPPPAGGPHYGQMLDALRGFLNGVAAAKPDDETVGALTRDLQAWSARLAPMAVGEAEQVFAHRLDLPGRGQTVWPPLVIEEGDDRFLRGTVTFSRYFLGGNGAVHGGVIPLVFDEVLGRFANSGGRSRARTAYLHVNYRSITPIEKPLELKGWFVGEEGRKRFMRGELWDGSTLCADAEGLFVQLRPGQP
jgi:hypothetical protein